jgi:hypothetical protein
LPRIGGDVNFTTPLLEDTNRVLRADFVDTSSTPHDAAGECNTVCLENGFTTASVPIYCGGRACADDMLLFGGFLQSAAGLVTAVGTRLPMVFEGESFVCVRTDNSSIPFTVYANSCTGKISNGQRIYRAYEKTLGPSCEYCNKKKDISGLN